MTLVIKDIVTGTFKCFFRAKRAVVHTVIAKPEAEPKLSLEQKYGPLIPGQYNDKPTEKLHADQEELTDAILHLKRHLADINKVLDKRQSEK